MINLRQVYLECEGNQALSWRSTSLRFASIAAGNLGAPLSLEIGGGSDDYESTDEPERSQNPLAAGLQLTVEDGEDHALLGRHIDSSKYVITLDIKLHCPVLTQLRKLNPDIGVARAVR